MSPAERRALALDRRHPPGARGPLLRSERACLVVGQRVRRDQVLAGELGQVPFWSGACRRWAAKAAARDLPDSAAW